MNAEPTTGAGSKLPSSSPGRLAGADQISPLTPTPHRATPGGGSKLTNPRQLTAADSQEKTSEAGGNLLRMEL